MKGHSSSHSPSARKVHPETQHQFTQLQILTRGHSANKQLLADGEQILQLLGMTGAVELIACSLEDLGETGGTLMIEQIDIGGCTTRLLFVQSHAQILVNAGYEPTIGDKLEGQEKINFNPGPNMLSNLRPTSVRF